MQKMRYRFVFKFLAIVLIVAVVFLIGMITGFCLQYQIDKHFVYSFESRNSRIKILPKSIPPEAINLHKIEEKFYKRYENCFDECFRLYFGDEGNAVIVNADFWLDVYWKDYPNHDLTREEIKKQIEEEIDLEIENFYEYQLTGLKNEIQNLKEELENAKNAI